MKQFGGKVSSELLDRYRQSGNWKGDRFQNLEETKMEIHLHSVPKLLYKQLIDKAGREPQIPLPIRQMEQERFLDDQHGAQLIWYGHSVCLLRIQGITLLIDPMLGPDASPIAPFRTRRFSENTLALIDELPKIDLLLLTHDHYDHLDMASMERLIPKIGNYYVALGTGRHLERWGVSPSSITEFDWWDSAEFQGIKLTFTPSRHFSGRGIRDRSKSLWGGWGIRTANENLYWSGDGGYGRHFQEIGERLGPFDFGFMECGQYNENWHQIHMYPEESVQAALDARVKRAIAVHWAGFALAQHHWKDPIERFVKEAQKKKLSIVTPRLGELISIHNNHQEEWWTEFN